MTPAAEAVRSGRRRILVRTAAVLRVQTAAALQSRAARQCAVIRTATERRILAAAAWGWDEWHVSEGFTHTRPNAGYSQPPASGGTNVRLAEDLLTNG